MTTREESYRVVPATVLIAHDLSEVPVQDQREADLIIVDSQIVSSRFTEVISK